MLILPARPVPLLYYSLSFLFLSPSFSFPCYFFPGPSLPLLPCPRLFLLLSSSSLFSITSPSSPPPRPPPLTSTAPSPHPPPPFPSPLLPPFFSPLPHSTALSCLFPLPLIFSCSPTHISPFPSPSSLFSSPISLFSQPYFPVPSTLISYFLSPPSPFNALPLTNSPPFVPSPPSCSSLCSPRFLPPPPSSYSPEAHPPDVSSIWREYQTVDRSTVTSNSYTVRETSWVLQ
jgi:hypothetical protein